MKYWKLYRKSFYILFIEMLLITFILGILNKFFNLFEDFVQSFYTLLIIIVVSQSIFDSSLTELDFMVLLPMKRINIVFSLFLRDVGRVFFLTVFVLSLFYFLLGENFVSNSEDIIVYGLVLFFIGINSVASLQPILILSHDAMRKNAFVKLLIMFFLSILLIFATSLPPIIFFLKNHVLSPTVTLIMYTIILTVVFLSISYKLLVKKEF
ncbi:hypothetical protein Calla_0034 [Caldicellulosiruptor acetigenus 6A]|uniref:Uncharacterized protein n=2 Tax=Caldicellulosiruptor acetigenus TaxID=301953 RepID=G2PV38_9FIRM|nr:hypothetical protein Calla_0034 [Caldicellulosiruptor acetigenus 6A]